MNYKKLAEISQAQVDVLMEAVKHLSSTVKSLTSEVSELKMLLLEKGKSKEEIERKLNGLLKTHLPKKIEKSNTVDKTLKIDMPALTPKERIKA